jgi:hypothetical protein
MKLANKVPTHCAACFQQRLGEPHVDFEAYYDGPVIDSESGVKMSIDDLVLCEVCVGKAAELLGYVKNEEAATELERLRKEVGELRALRARNSRKLSAIEKAVGVPA